MAKASTKTTVAEAPKTNLPAPAAQAPAGVPAHLADRLAHSQGRGVSTAREDNIVPLLLVLQKSSPQTDDRGDDYVEGAKAGELWVRGTSRVISGTTGVVVQPCAFWKGFLEWGPKRGDGLKGRHDDRPEDAFEKEVTNDEGKKETVWARPSGNILVETREHYVLIGQDAYVIPFSSTGHTVSREWMNLMNSFRDSRGRPLDSFSRQYKLTTVRKEKGGNTWYVIKAVDAGWVESAEQYDLGAALFTAVSSGEKVADTPDSEPDGGGAGGGRGESAGPRTSDLDAEKVGI